MAMSTIEPIKVELIKLDNNNATFKLRDNITTQVISNELTNINTTFFNYNEYELNLTYTGENQIHEIESNFLTYWNLAIKQLDNKKVLEDKKKQIADLIDNGNYKLIDVNQQTQSDLDTLLLGLMDAYEQILMMMSQ